MNWLSKPLVWSALLGSLSCSSGGQTGDETQTPCHEVASDLALDDPTSLGVSAAQVLALAPAQASLSLEWLDVSPLHYGPESGLGTLAITLAAAGTPRFIKSEIAPGPHSLLTPECTDHLEIPVHVQLSTAAGAFDESVDAIVRAQGAQLASASLSFQPGSLGGRFAFESASLGQDQWKTLTVDLQLRGGEFAGVVRASMQQSIGYVTSIRDVVVACFPSPTASGASGPNCPN